MKVSYKVPATTANIGPGFDCLGMALPVYNIVTIEETSSPAKNIDINLISDIENAIETNIDNISRDNSNIVYKAVEELYCMVGKDVGGLNISIQTGIPVARGLGSSASVIVGGLLAANDLLGKPADTDALLSIASEIEGHPDNVAPAILGGVVFSSMEDDGSIMYKQLSWNDDWIVTVCVPDFELPTSVSRSVLAKNVSMDDAIFNSKRLSMLIHAIDTKDTNLMKYALQDKLHQPYREKLITGFKEIKDSFKSNGAVLGTVISGAGPSILVISTKDDLENIKNNVKTIWGELNVSSFIKSMPIEEQGARKIQ